ncbi:MAG: hypothetical protein ACPG21_05285 [Crocinitomicaceae bacterium]
MRSWLTIAVLFYFGASYGQRAYVELDTHKMRIGEQTILHLYLEYQNPNGNALINWPQFDGAITNDIEVVRQSVDRDKLIDSISHTYLREQELLITIFEAGEYIIPPQAIGYNDTSLVSNEAFISVETVEVDTSKGIADIKPIYTVNYPFAERSRDWLKENWIWIAIIAILIIAFFIWRYWMKKRQNKPVQEPVKEVIPAHIMALTILNRLKEKEEWKSPQKKKYYSELTDTVRLYLENRFSIRAMEQTTREILLHLNHANISEEDKLYLRKILQEADMVKFAKFTPDDIDAFNYLQKSIDFVNRTKRNED